MTLAPLPPLPVDTTAEGKDVKPLPPFIILISVISPEPEPASCTILLPVYTSPLTVSSSNTMWSVDVAPLVPFSGVIPPLTTDTFAVTPPPLVPVVVKVKSSPIA